MSFHRSQKKRSPSGPRHTPDEIRLAVSKGKKSRSLHVLLGVQIAEKIGMGVGKRCDVLWGANDDLGYIKLIADERGLLIRQSGKSGTRLLCNTSAFPEWVKPFSSQTVEILSTDEDGGIILKVPPPRKDSKTAEPVEPAEAVEAVEAVEAPEISGRWLSSEASDPQPDGFIREKKSTLRLKRD